MRHDPVFGFIKTAPEMLVASDKQRVHPAALCGLYDLGGSDRRPRLPAPEKCLDLIQFFALPGFGGRGSQRVGAAMQIIWPHRIGIFAYPVGAHHCQCGDTAEISLDFRLRRQDQRRGVCSDVPFDRSGNAIQQLDDLGLAQLFRRITQRLCFRQATGFPPGRGSVMGLLVLSNSANRSDPLR
jgi:hypothetical protein